MCTIVRGAGVHKSFSWIVTHYLQSKRETLSIPRDSRTEQRVMLGLIFNGPEFQQTSSDLKSQWSLKNRLQQARKFVLLVQVFGSNILHIVPEVSVTRLDSLRLSDLQKLANQAEGSPRVQEILGKMKSGIIFP